jgi:hypothetical protein
MNSECLAYSYAHKIRRKRGEMNGKIVSYASFLLILALFSVESWRLLGYMGVYWECCWSLRWQTESGTFEQENS